MIENNPNGYSYQTGGSPNAFRPSYGMNGFMPDEKTVEKKRISSVSIACGFAIAGFILLSVLLGFLLNAVLPNYEAMYEEPFFYEALNMFSSAILICGPFLFAYLALKKRKIAGELILGTPYDRKDFLQLIPVALMLCVIGSLMTSYFAEFVDWAFGIGFEVPEDISDYKSVGGVLLSVLTTAVVPAFVEEFAVRGVVMQSLRRYGDWFAIVMSSFVFAIMHGNMIQIPFAFIAGIGIGYAVIKTGTMWTGVIIHFLNNLIAVIYSVVYENLSEGGAAAVFAVIYVVVFLVGIACLISYRGRHPHPLKLSRGKVTCLKRGEKVKRFIFTVPMIIAIAVLCYETSLFVSF